MCAMKISAQYATWTEIDLGAIENNARRIIELTGVQLMVVVKAYGYGHGANHTSRAALRGGATWCGVARVEEARALRRGGIETPILILGMTPDQHLAWMIEQAVSLTVWDPAQVRRIEEIARQVGKPARLHLKLDSGMSRLGAFPEECLALAAMIKSSSDLIFEGLMTHFATADEIDRHPADEQERIFRQVLQEIEAAGLRPPLVHAANSAATLSRPQAHFDLVRAGNAVYGMHPSPDCRLPEGFRPALAWKAQLIRVKTLPGRSGVGYGHSYVTRTAERIGTVSVGYADGFRRVPGNVVLVGGQRVPVVGRVSMDQIMVSLAAVPEAEVGDEVVLLGRQGEEQISAEEIAATWKTINYEVTCGLNFRVPRIYR